jgi:hypothetical protein
MAGIGTAFVVVFAVEMIGIRIWPQPPGMNPLHAESVRQHLSERLHQRLDQECLRETRTPRRWQCGCLDAHR